MGDSPTNITSFEPVDPLKIHIPDMKQNMMFFINVGWLYNQSNNESHSDWQNFWNMRWHLSDSVSR